MEKITNIRWYLSMDTCVLINYPNMIAVYICLTECLKASLEISPLASEQIVVKFLVDHHGGF